MPRALFTVLGAAAFLLAAPAALACPYCAAQDKGDGLGTYLVLTAMVLFPFAVVAVVWPLVRRAGTEDSRTRGSLGEDSTP